MVLPDSYSRRSRAHNIEVYIYDHVPSKLRVQIIHILKSAIGDYYKGERYETRPEKYWNFIHQYMLDELGKFFLSSPQEHSTHKNLCQDFIDWFRTESTPVDSFLDALEISMRVIDRLIRDKSDYIKKFSDRIPDQALNELNARMQEAGFGFQYSKGNIVKIDNMIAHKEMVLPALEILYDTKYKAANEEYRSAHKAYREKRSENCITDCAKAFESVLKVIAKERNWPNIDENSNAKRLLDAAFSNDFLLPSLNSNFGSLRSLLEGGIPTIRNKSGAHGAGIEARDVSDSLVAFQLHQTAAAIILLAETHEEK